MTLLFPDMHRRPGTLDDFIIQEARGYIPLFFNLSNHDRSVVLDVGANIGSFTRLALGYNPARVVAIEPDPENCACFRTNVVSSQHLSERDREKVTLIEAAIMNDGGEGLRLPLFLNTGKNKGIHSMAPHRGRDTIDVATIDWRATVQDVRPTHVKIDIEGGEYALNLSQLNDECRALAIELHLTKKEWRQEQAPRVLKQLAELGFKATVEKPDLSGKRWTSFYIFHR